MKFLLLLNKFSVELIEKLGLKFKYSPSTSGILSDKENNYLQVLNNLII